MKRLFLSLLIVNTCFLLALEISPASASTSEKKPGFFERRRLEKEQKKALKLEEENRTQVSTPFNVRRQVPEVLSPSPQKIDQNYTSEQRQITDEKNTFNIQRQQPSSKEGFQLNPGNRSSIILPPQTFLSPHRSNQFYPTCPMQWSCP